MVLLGTHPVAGAGRCNPRGGADGKNELIPVRLGGNLLRLFLQNVRSLGGGRGSGQRGQSAGR